MLSCDIYTKKLLCQFQEGNVSHAVTSTHGRTRSLQEQWRKMNCLSLAATRGYGPPRLSQYIIFCTDCRQSISRHMQTNIQKLCCKAAQEESQYQRESLANFWGQRKQPMSLHPLHGVSLAPWEQTVAGLQRAALPSLKTNISALLTTAMCPKNLFFPRYTT